MYDGWHRFLGLQMLCITHIASLTTNTILCAGWAPSEILMCPLQAHGALPHVLRPLSGVQVRAFTDVPYSHTPPGRNHLAVPGKQSLCMSSSGC